MARKRDREATGKAPAAPALVPCPPCSGSGRMRVRVTEATPGGARESSVEMKCITCNGEGKVLPRVIAELERERQIWCACATPGEPQYFADGEDGEVWKHHWRCRSCGKVLQIG